MKIHHVALSALVALSLTTPLQAEPYKGKSPPPDELLLKSIGSSTASIIGNIESDDCYQVFYKTRKNDESLRCTVP